MMDSRRTFILLMALGLIGKASLPVLAKDDGDGGDGGGGGDGADGGDDADSGDSDDAEKDAEEPGGEAIRDAVRKGEARSLSDILAKVSRTYPGEVVRIRLKGKDEGLQYRIRILQRNGERIEIRVNARTGRIIKADN